MRTLAWITSLARGGVLVRGALTRSLGTFTGEAAGTAVMPSPPEKWLAQEQTAFLTFLDAKAPTFLGFLGVGHEWVADLTFLDLLELQVVVWLESEGAVVAAGMVGMGLVQVPAFYDDGDVYDQNEYGAG